MSQCNCAPDCNCIPVRTGETVPDFTLTTYDPRTGDFGKFDLAAQRAARRWTILFFYPADFTFVCATEFSALAEQNDRFLKHNTDIVTVSRDTQYTHLAWQKHEGELANVKYQMGADVTGKLGRLFGVLDENAGLTLRGTFIISPDGKLTSSEVNFFNMGRNVDEIYRKLRAAVHLSTHASEVCPAKWKQEGDKTLTPNAKMVGNVHEAMQG